MKTRSRTSGVQVIERLSSLGLLGSQECDSHSPPWDRGRGSGRGGKQQEGSGGPHLAVSLRETRVSGLRVGRRGPPILADSSPEKFLSRRTSQSPQGGSLRQWTGRKEKGDPMILRKWGRAVGQSLLLLLLLRAQGAPSLPANGIAYVPTSTLLTHENESNAINSTRNRPHSAQDDKTSIAHILILVYCSRKENESILHISGLQQVCRHSPSHPWTTSPTGDNLASARKEHFRGTDTGSDATCNRFSNL